jgi:hypothetical protein
VDHSIIGIYVKSLLSFREKLLQVGERDIDKKVEQKKNEMIHALKRELETALK